MRHTPPPLHYQRCFALAFSLAVALLVVALTPAAMTEISPITFFGLIYFWLLFAPLAMNAPSVFALGLVCDVLMGTPLGAFPLVGLLLFWLIQREEKHIPRRFLSIWMHYLICLGLAFSLLWGVLSLFRWSPLDWNPLAMQAALTFFCYPLLHSLLLIFITMLKMGADD